MRLRTFIAGLVAALGPIGLAFLLIIAASIIGTASARADSGPTRFHAVSINVNTYDSPARIRADVRNAAKRGGLIGWQEANAQARATIEALPGFASYSPARLPIPISWRTRYWTFEDGGYVRLMEAKPGTGPDRYAVWAILRRRGSDLRVARVNTHFVAHAWCKHHVAYKAWRQYAWHRSATELRYLVDSLARKGYVPIVSGDFNRNRYPVLGNAVRYDNGLRDVTFKSSAHYDYLMHVPSKLVTARGHETLRGFYSDHHLVVTHYTTP